MPNLDFLPIVKSSWSAANNKNVNISVVFTEESEYAKSSQEEELTGMVDLDSCVLLRRENKADDYPCKVDISLGENTLSRSISEIVVVSEARFVEVYLGEYLTTVPATFLDKVDDMAVYVSVIKLKKPTHQFSLKFLKLQRPSEIWLYGIRVVWKRCDADEVQSNMQGSTFDYKAIGQRFKESETVLSDRAGNFLKFLENFELSKGGSNSSADKNFSLNFLKLMPEMLSGRSEKMSFCSTLAQNFQPKEEKFTSKSEDKISQSSPTQLKCLSSATEENSTAVSSSIESIIDDKFISLERKILSVLNCKNVSEQIREQQNRVCDERILNTLRCVVGQQIQNLEENLSMTIKASQQSQSGDFELMLNKKLECLEFRLLSLMDEKIQSMQSHLERQLDQKIEKILSKITSSVKINDINETKNDVENGNQQDETNHKNGNIFGVIQ